MDFNGMPCAEEDIRDHVKNLQPVTMMNTPGSSVGNTERDILPDCLPEYGSRRFAAISLEDGIRDCTVWAVW